MRTDAQEYLDLLYAIQSENKPQKAVLLPSDERVFEIDLNQKTIETPEFLSVETDHTAETIYFRCARYFDNMDLTETTCVVQYINAAGVGGIYFVPYYDVITHMDLDEMIFPWVISGRATAAAGTVKFSVRFYKIAGEIGNSRYTYVLNTLPTQSKVLHGMDSVMDQLYIPAEVTAKSYLPGVFYYLDGNNYVLDISETFTPGRKYFKTLEYDFTADILTEIYARIAEQHTVLFWDHLV